MRTPILGAVLLALAASAAAAAATATSLPNIGRPVQMPRPIFKGYYDHHLDTYLITDVSSKTQAAAMHVNFSTGLKSAKSLPAQYFVKGRAAPGQLTVFGSEPGESDYNPLWEEFWVTWKPGVKPVLLGQDNQITSLAKAGKLTVTNAHVVLDAPIVTVGKGK